MSPAYPTRSAAMKKRRATAQAMPADIPVATTDATVDATAVATLPAVAPAPKRVMKPRATKTVAVTSTTRTSDKAVTKTMKKTATSAPAAAPAQRTATRPARTARATPVAPTMEAPATDPAVAQAAVTAPLLPQPTTITDAPPPARKAKPVALSLALHPDEAALLKSVKQACKAAAVEANKQALLRIAVTLLATVDLMTLGLKLTQLPLLKTPGKKKA